MVPPAVALRLDLPPAPSTFELPPKQALDYFRHKGLRPSFAWQDMAEGEHAHAFTIAKMLDIDLLADVRASLDQALEKGTAFENWAKDITQLLERKGWWGRKAVTDPLTGEEVAVQLGSAARLETIFRTNIQSAYMAGQWEQIEAQKREAPYLMYDAIDDHRTRDEHRAWDGTILPVDSPWWQYHCPQCGWNCRCGLIQLSADELEALGLKVSREPKTATYQWTNPRTGKVERVAVGVDPGFGKRPLVKPYQQQAKLDQLLQEKIATLPPDLAENANIGVDATAKVVANEQTGGPPKVPEVRRLSPPLPYGEAAPDIRADARRHEAMVQRAKAAMRRDGDVFVGEAPLEVQTWARETQDKVAKALRLSATQPITGVSGLDRVQAERDASLHGRMHWNGVLVLRISTEESADYRTVVHEIVHTLGGTQRRAYRGPARALEEATSEELTQAYFGVTWKQVHQGDRVSVSDPEAALQMWRADPPTLGATGAYPDARARIVSAVAAATGEDDPQVVVDRVRAAMRSWKKKSYASAEEAQRAFIRALRPETPAQRAFYERVLLDAEWEP